MRISQRVVWLSIACALLGSATDGASVMVRDVRAEHGGVGRIEERSVLVHVSVRAGAELDPQAVSRDVKSLQETGRFSFVGVAVEKAGDEVDVVYKVHPRPIIRKIDIDGADYMSNKKVFDKLELGPGDLVDDAVLAVQSRGVVEAYNKKYYPDAKVTWTIDEDEEAGTADIKILIEEGDRARVKQIRFVGNANASAWELRKTMQQKRVNILSWLTGRGAYSAEVLEGDGLLLRKLYRKKGYLDATIGVPEVTRKGKRNLHLSVPIEEGKQYRVGTISIEGVTLFDPHEVKTRSLRIQPGEVAAMNLIEATGQAIRDYYGSRGYINSRAAPGLDADPELRRVDIVFRVREGTQASIRNVSIRGNTRTKDKVIRRELKVAPGDIFNEVRVRQSERILRNLGYFGFVGSSPVPTDKPEEYDLVFDVEEQRSGQFVIGAGFSSVDQIVGFVELSQGNFDIANWPRFTGGGQKFKIKVQLGTKRRDWQLSFIEPWFLDRRLALGLDVFQHEREFLSDDYDQLNTGGSASLTKPLRGPYRTKFTYSIQEIEVKDVNPGASDIIKAEEGTRTKSAGTLELIRDTRDNVFIPSRGDRSVAGATLAGGPFAGETDIYELALRSTTYWPLWYDHIFNVRGRLVTVEEYDSSSTVPIFDRLFLGGARTLRGFDFRDVGPKDERGESIGGDSLGTVTAEYTIPIIEQIRVAGFYDIGFVNKDSFDFSTSDYNSDVGVGLRLYIPGFPVQLDYAWPLEADLFNDRNSGRFNFFIGYQN